MYKLPLWDTASRTVTGESGLFRGTKPVRLLYSAEKILKLYNPTLGTVYTQDVHFTHTPGSDLIYPVLGSGICGIEEAEIFPDPANAAPYPALNANAVIGGPEGKLLLFDNGTFFARHQFNVDYQATADTVFLELPAPVYGTLERFTAGLKAGTTMTVNLIGDSISEGFNSSEFVKCPPWAPPYLYIFAQALKRRFHTHVHARNSAISGTCSEQAFKIEERWLEPPCDLLIIAYGMNDIVGKTPEEYGAQIKKIMERKRSVHPETEFLLVSSMTRNPIWLTPCDEKAQLFADELKKLAGPGCAVADVHAFWCQLLKKKDFYDLTGNGVNHPNDYGHRVYNAVLENIFS